MISRSNSGEQGNGSTYITQLTPDGRFAVFDSEACNRVPHDTEQSTGRVHPRPASLVALPRQGRAAELQSE